MIWSLIITKHSFIGQMLTKMTFHRLQQESLKLLHLVRILNLCKQPEEDEVHCIYTYVCVCLCVIFK